MSESTRETVIALIRLITGLAAAVLCCYGFAVDADTLFNVASAIVAVVIFIRAWWKNNNITSAASDAQCLLDIAKATEDMTDTDDYSCDNEDGVE